MVVYDLWAVDTGNVIGTFETEDEALAIVRVLIETYGLDYGDDLDLGWLDEHGEGHSLTSGAALLDRVRAAGLEPVAASEGARPS